METIIKKAGKEAYALAGEFLKAGRTAAFPTDTVYGLGAVYTNEAAVKKIFEAKGRDEHKPLSILVSSPDEACKLSDNISEDALKLMKAFWPGALTVIVKKNASVPDCVSAGKDTVGIRMPALEAALEIIKAAQSPLAAPSANLSGKRSSAAFEDVYEDLNGRIDMIIDGGRCPGGVSSTVVDISDGNIEILREGRITLAMMEEVLNGWQPPGR